MADRIFQFFMLFVALIVGIVLGSHYGPQLNIAQFAQELQDFFVAMLPVLATGALIKYLFS